MPAADARGRHKNPTCANFLNNVPVAAPPGPHTRRALNRKGRAICRIVHAHGWKIAGIADIMRVHYSSVHRAVSNAYVPRDNVSKDYSHVGIDFRKHFPPSAESEAADWLRMRVMALTEVTLKKTATAGVETGPLDPSDNESTSSDKVKSETDDEHEVDYHVGRSINPPVRTSPLRADAGGPHMRMTRLLPPAQPNPMRSKPHMAAPPTPRTPGIGLLRTANTGNPRTKPAAGPGLRKFLQDAAGFDLTVHLPLLVACGIGDVAVLRTMAAWDDAALHRALRQLLTAAGSPDLEGGAGLNGVELIALEMAVQGLRQG
ncbi:hypothetical protein GGX14DRAFT_461107, partial [Mycena pura]